ncbi:MAG: biosynthetic arginine decarboxylase [Verrucomicrobiota bacterium]
MPPVSISETTGAVELPVGGVLENRPEGSIYGEAQWGIGYYGVSAEGEATVSLRDRETGEEQAVSLKRIVRQLEIDGIRAPVLLRFPDLLESRLQRLHGAFGEAMAGADYAGDYRGLYPVKVNQRQEVVEAVTSAGRRYHYGLEVGSKAELVAALGYMSDPEGYIVCNGYKDSEYVELALRARKMGYPVVLVLETPAELEMVWEGGKRQGVRPVIGIRLRLTQKGNGKWGGTSGVDGLFGFTVAQIVDAIDFLKECEGLDCLEMLHYHQGSQLPDLRAIECAAREAACVYASLVAEGAKMGVLNVGGGLAVDYDGSRTAYTSSKNYTMEEYCAAIVGAVKSVATEAGIAHPRLASESGRAVAAYYSVLVFNIMGAGSLDESDCEVEAKSAGVRNGNAGMVEATRSKSEVCQLFLEGKVSLRDRARAERDCERFEERIRQASGGRGDVNGHANGNGGVAGNGILGANGSGRESGDRDHYYFGNFSVFQSLPDHWAIGQMFPVMPLQRLDEEPDRRAVIADLTCDSDGKIGHYIDRHEDRSALPVHRIGKDEEYLIGVFLVGAYQETLGDMHNLFGRTHAVSVELRAGEVVVNRMTRGNLIRDVLAFLEYEPSMLEGQVRAMAKRAVAEERISLAESEEILKSYVNNLSSYTYLSPNGDRPES